MGLNPRGRGRARGNKASFQIKGRRGGRVMGPRQMFRPSPTGMFYPPVGFPPQAFGSPPSFGGPSAFYIGSPRPAFGKFPRNNFKRKVLSKSNSTYAVEIDLTKPWVNEEIKNEEAKKQELLQIWRKTKTDEDWNNYKAQKLAVQTLYDKAKAEYASSHPDEAVLWNNVSTIGNYYCETCDKSFRTDEDFFLHEAEHETCGRDGCEFTAHPKIIAKHIKMQHMSGLFKRIGKLYSEEDIAKWIEERKKRYPTRKVVEEKKIFEEEKLSRGERIKDNDSKFNKQFHNKKKNNAKKNCEKKTSKNNRIRRTRKKKCPSVVQKSLEEETSAFRKGVPAFLGINSGSEPEGLEKRDLNISDEEWDTECKLQTPPKPVLNNSLGLLAACYNSEEENQNEEFNKETKVNVISADEGSGPEEVATVSSKNPYTKGNSNEEKGSHKRKLLNKKYNPEKKRQNTSNACSLDKRDLTLLEKLLKKEIRHERNVILQCVHFVVKNKFFKT